MPADIETEADIDRTDLIEDDEDDSEVLEAIRKALEEGADDSAPIGRAFPELDEEGRDEMVTLEKGLELIDKAAIPAQRKPKGDDADAEAPKPAEIEAAQKVANGAGETDQPADAAAQADAADPYADLLAGIDGERRETLTGRLRQADDILSIFAGHESEMEAHGVTPVQHMRSLAQIDQFARKNPDKYLAWAATEIGKDKAEDLIIKAAEHLGLKVSREEDDPFEDEGVKKLREENRALKAQNRNLGFSPFEAAPPTATDLAAWVEEKAPDGSLKRPLFRDLEAGISRMAQEHRAKTGRAVTFADLDGFYSELTAKIGGVQPQRAPAPVQAQQQPPAAQPQTPVAGGVQKAAAPGSVERAKAASKNLDGSGQGASRRPALPADADLDATLRHFMGGQVG